MSRNVLAVISRFRFRRRMLFPARNHWVSLICCWAVALLLSATRSEGAQVSDEQIEAGIQKGVEFLLRQGTDPSAHGSELAAYALYRGGVEADHPQIQQVIKHIQGSIDSGAYRPKSDHFYTAGTAAMLLEAVDREMYQPELQAIANYIIAGQSQGGSWYYPDQNQANNGDTSISQYALLGLWAARKAGIEVPQRVWDKAASWLRRTQVRDGFTYHPLNTTDGQAPTHSMTAAGTSSLILCRRELYPGSDDRIFLGTRPNVKSQAKLYGILELVDITQEEGTAKPKVPANPDDDYQLTNSPNELNAHIRRGVNWLETNYEIETRDRNWNYYYLYGLERTAGFGEIEKLGSHDWYRDGAQFLLSKQNTNGSWQDEDTPRTSTSFCVLFLAQATRQALDRPLKKTINVGTGLLTAGRGLPDDLTAVQVKDGKVETLKSSAPIGELLSQLEAGSTADLTPIEEQVIESVRSEDREQLIGQVDRLKTLLKSKEPRVRGIALWALARSNDLTLAPLFIKAFDDRDFDVALEANRGLCLLSRKLSGVGLPADPLAGERDSKTPEEQKAIADKWRTEAKGRWQDWYLRVRTYDERDDLLDRPRKK